MDWRSCVEDLRRYISSKRATRMFSSVKSTWNVGKGCTHLCAYCNVSHVFVPRLRGNPSTEKYRDGFTVRLFEGELEKPSYKRRGPGLVFIWYMGDWLCGAVPDEWILRILGVVKSDPGNEFLSCTKNPPRYIELADRYGWSIFPDNLWLGATIESNLPIADRFTRAPPVEERYRAMAEVAGHKEKIFLSIEPIMDFEPEGFLGWVEDMEVKVCEVGADNYRVVELPEPPAWKVRRVLEGLTLTVPLVVQKKGLERLLGGGKLG